MKKAIICAALAGVFSAGVAMNSQAADVSGKVKCYGIAEAGKNDCKSADGSHSCAGAATSDNSGNEWKFAKNEDACDTAGGSLEPEEMMQEDESESTEE
jgi:uncharacterized membrane protein